jgi:hypothetical protein
VAERVDCLGTDRVDVVEGRSLAQALSRRFFLHAWLGGLVAPAGCYVERKKDVAIAGSAGGSAAVDIASADGEAALRRAVHWLLDRQALPISQRRTTLGRPRIELPPEQDGGWHSTKYAQLTSGQSLTPLVAWGLHQSNVNIHQRLVIWFFIEGFYSRSFDHEGKVRIRDAELIEYPNYATALVLRCLSQQDVGGGHGETIAEMTRYLVGQQYREANGFGPEHVAYGGWGFGGRLPVGGSSGHMDVAHTRHVLEALRAAGHDDAETYRRAERFLRLVQKHPTEDREQPSLRNGMKPEGAKRKPPYDGGFYFSPVVLAANKAGEAEHEGRPYFRSYATATCEGVLALLACGVKRDDERIRAAVGWLERHPRLDYPEGIPADQHENWGASIRYYHYAVRSQCYAALDWPDSWRQDLRAELARRQEADGSFVNRDGILMKEDDPILCTALAVLALGYAQKE